jgi:hypothetical protein
VRIETGIDRSHHRIETEITETGAGVEISNKIGIETTEIRDKVRDKTATERSNTEEKVSETTGVRIETDQGVQRVDLETGEISAETEETREPEVSAETAETVEETGIIHPEETGEMVGETTGETDQVQQTLQTVEKDNLVAETGDSLGVLAETEVGGDHSPVKEAECNQALTVAQHTTHVTQSTV